MAKVIDAGAARQKRQIESIRFYKEILKRAFTRSLRVPEDISPSHCCGWAEKKFTPADEMISAAGKIVKNQNDEGGKPPSNLF
jgi:hypothetical protein